MSAGVVGQPARSSTEAIVAAGTSARRRLARISSHSRAVRCVSVRRAGRRRLFPLERSPARVAELRAEACLEIGARDATSGAMREDRRRAGPPGSAAIVSVATATCSPCKYALASGRGEHVDVMADEVLALARRIAAVAQRHAEAGKHQRARERAHRAEVAAKQCLGLRPARPARRRPAARTARSGTAFRADDGKAANRPAPSIGKARRRGPPGSSVPERRASTERSMKTPSGAAAGSVSLWPSTVIAAFIDV